MLTGQQVDHYQTFGFVVLPGYLGERETADLGTELDQALRDGYGARDSAPWFSRLCEGGRVVDDLQTRPWGASDGQVIDSYGRHWLIGLEGEEST